MLKPVIDGVMGDPKIVPEDFPFFPRHPLRGGKKLDVRAMHQTLAQQLTDHLDLEALAAWPN